MRINGNRVFHKVISEHIVIAYLLMILDIIICAKQVTIRNPVFLLNQDLLSHDMCPTLS